MNTGIISNNLPFWTFVFSEKLCNCFHVVLPEFCIIRTTSTSKVSRSDRLYQRLLVGIYAQKDPAHTCALSLVTERNWIRTNGAKAKVHLHVICPQFLSNFRLSFCGSCLRNYQEKECFVTHSSLLSFSLILKQQDSKILVELLS